MKTLKGSILVVDDTPANLRLLAELLTREGYKVRPVTDGQRAIAAARVKPPDLMLLDILMPDMDGYEVCRRLKSDERTREIPVIFISALNEVIDKVKALSVGGVDYITKPFHVDEVLARIRTHLILQHTRRKLQDRNELLEQQNKELDSFAHTVAHNLKNPLTSILAYSEMLYDETIEVEPHELKTLGADIRQSAQKAVNIIEDLLLLAGVRKAAVECAPLDMTRIINHVQERLKWMITRYQGEIFLPHTWPVALGYAPWVEEVWTNYLSNGLKYGGNPPRLELGADLQSDDMVRFWLRDNGHGIAPDAQTNLFTEFTRLKEVRTDGYGLGLSIVQRIIDKLDGQCGVESDSDQGSIFYFTLPQLKE